MSRPTVSPTAVSPARPVPVQPAGGHRFALARLAAVLAGQAAARQLESLEDLDPVAADVAQSRAVADWLHSHAPAGLEGR